MTDNKWVALAVNPDLPIREPPVEKALQGGLHSRQSISPIENYQRVRNTLCTATRGASGLLLRSDYVTNSLIGKLPALKVIGVHGTGVDPVDVDASSKNEITVTNTPGVNADAVAELSFGLMISLLRKTLKAQDLR